MTLPPDRPPAGSPGEWLRHAQSDIALARLAKDQAGVLPEQMCFHAQQAVEKALKAVLAHRRAEFPLVHDIEALLAVAGQVGITIPPEIAETGSLTPYAVEARYPGHEEAVTAEEAARALRLAEQAVRWAAGKIATGPVAG